jgi:adenylylsulfate kinase
VILVVCGPPGAGKTTVATRLQERLAERGRPFRLLHSDDFRRNTYERLYERVAGSDDDYIVDGTFYRRGHQERFRRLDDVVFVRLRADLDTCLARNAARADPIDEKGVHVVHAEFHEFDADVAVDTDERSPEETVAAVLRGLEPYLDAA